MKLFRNYPIARALQVLCATLGLLLVLTQGLWAKPVDVKTARLVAERWSGESLKLPAAARALVVSPPAALGAEGALYFFELQPQGLVVVAADDAAHPVVFYTDTKVDLQKSRPPQFDGMIRGAADAIRAAQAQGAQALPASQAEWGRLTAPAFVPRANAALSVVSPLLNVHWDQSRYYNALCPLDSTASSYYDGRACVGCVAVSMSQVMWYYGYPAHGTGSHSYTPASHPEYGVQSANFGATTYNWSDMPSSLSDYNDSVATLLYQAGVSVDMDYGPDGTGGSGADETVAVSALINNFGYSSNAQYVQRAYYSDTDWLNLLYADLDAGHPLIYTGQGSAGGHSFNIDGYSQPGYFHLNWGWSGYYDGYFYLDNLAPGGETFNNYQGAVINLQPASLPSGTDLIANRAYLASDSAGAHELTNPQPGNALYLCLDYTYTGTADLTGCVVAVTLDGSPFASSPEDITASTSHAIFVAGPYTSATLGQHTQVWTLDVTNSVVETNENNNSAQQTFTVGGTPASGDLIAYRSFLSTDVSGSPEVTEAEAGTPVYFFVECAWTGNVEIPSCEVTMQLDGVTTVQGALDIPVDANHFYIYTTTPWSAEVGQHSFTWELNSNNAVSETDLSNDSAQASFSVTSPIVSPDATSIWVPRQRNMITWDPTIPTGKKVQLDLFKDGLYFATIKKKANNNGGLIYRLPVKYPHRVLVLPGSTYQVVLTELYGEGRTFPSAMFTIGALNATDASPAASPSVTVRSVPNLGVAMEPVVAVTAQ